MKVKEVIWLILIILGGVGIYYLQNFQLQIDDWEIIPFSKGKVYQFEENLSLEPSSTIEILNSHGQVEIEGSERNNIDVKLEKKIWRQNEESARTVAEQLKILTSKNGERLIISTNRDRLRKRNFSTDFKIYVPQNLKIKITNSHGAVRISRVREADVSNYHGRVEINEVTGSVRAVNSYEPLAIMDIGGESQIETNYSTLLLSRLSGPITVNCAHEEVRLFELHAPLHFFSKHSRIKAVGLAGPSEISGTYEPISIAESGSLRIEGHHSPIEIDNLKGKLEIETSYEHIRLSRIEGTDLIIKSKDTEINLDSIQVNNIHLETSYENVLASNFSGQLLLIASHNDISLKPSDLNHSINVQADYSEIKFYWPDNQTARLEAETKGGNISWQLPFSPDENRNNGLAIIKAFSQAQDRPEIKLKTTYADIQILKKE
jgi:hypothetical protein